jgi:ABC-2 type transport system permease protein
MNLRIIRAIMVKDLKDVVKNKATLYALLTPIFLALLYLVITIAQKQGPTVIVAYNPDNVAITQTLGLRPSDKVEIHNVNSADEVRTAMHAADLNADYGVVIPAHAIADAMAGKRPQVELYINAAKQQDESTRQRTSIYFDNYFIAAANQQPPVKLVSEVVNVPKDANSNPRSKFFSNPNALGSFYGGFTLALTPIIIGMLVLPVLIVEEKEKKTLRFVLTTPARTSEVVIAKAAIGFLYSLLLAALVLRINSGSVSDIGLVALFVVIGSLFGVAMGILIGAFFNNVQAVNTWAGMLMTLMILPGIFVIFGATGIFAILLRIIPSYWLMDGMVGAAMGSLDSNTALLDLGLSIAVVVVLLALAMVVLRRRSLEAA